MKGINMGVDESYAYRSLTGPYQEACDDIQPGRIGYPAIPPMTTAEKMDILANINFEHKREINGWHSTIGYNMHGVWFGTDAPIEIPTTRISLWQAFDLRGLLYKLEHKS